MIAALLGAALAAPYVDGTGGVHLRLDTSATWGIGGQMFLGGQAHLGCQIPAWRTARASGTFDVGAQLAYGNEALFLAPWIDRETTSGATHRVQAVVVVGTTFHMGPEQRVSLGLQWFGGLNHWRSDYTVTIDEIGLDESAVVTRNLAVTGGQVTLAGRLSERVGLNLVLQAPLPLPSSYAVGLASIGVGPVFYLK
jgi:hypothetical protein